MTAEKSGYPRRGFAFGRWFGSLVLRLLGWRLSGPLPELPKSILVVAPHTSNWDFVIGMAAALHLDLDADWLAKESLFRGVWGRLLLWLGGIPVDRSKAHGVIEQVIATAGEREHILLAITPEATRKPRQRWKTGFYFISRGSGIPLVPIAFDYPRKQIIINKPYHPGENLEQEMEHLSQFYSAAKACRPENFLRHQS